MIKRMKKPISLLLSLLMVVSLFAAVPFTASATVYDALVYANDLQVGDTLVNGCFLENNGYTIYLKGGTYSDDSYSIDGYIPAEDALIFAGSFGYLEFDDNMPVIHTSDIFPRYIFVDAEGNRSDTIYVLAVDHDHSEITLGGHDPDRAAADTVIGLIDDIGTVEYTPESEALIVAARDAYDALTDTQQVLVTNYTDLTDAETAYAALFNYGVAAKKYFKGKPETPEVVENIVDLSTLDDDYEAQNGDVLTGTLAGDYKITIAVGAAVTLRDAVISCLTNDAYFAGITPLGDATITLEGANVVKNGNNAYPGIYVPENKTLTIDGTGSLDASSSVNDGGTGCGIGGGDHISAGNIVINGGTITANGGSEAAGIGCGPGPETYSGNIVINGGTVTAIGGHKSAGIGSGVYDSNCGDIVINGGTVTATGGYEGVGIGSGASGSCGDITISGGKVTAEAGYGWYCPGIGAGKEQATCGNILIKNTVTEVWAVSNAENAPLGAGQSSTCGIVRIESGANVNLI